MTDHDIERTFEALPPAQGRAFARTWWGQAWLRALEDTALDSVQLKAGRRLARAGALGAVSVRPGRITALVRDRDRTSHRADVLLPELSDEQWGRFLDIAVERAGHVAALLDREMPPHLVEDGALAGVELLPGVGELEPECDCGSWDHCGHTAALCYQMARLLDEDPFVLLLMRGRGEGALLDDLQTRATGPAEDRSCPRVPSPEGVDAAEAYATGDILPPLPALPEPPEQPGQPPSLDTDTPPGPGVEPSALEFLAAQAAKEARVLLVDALDPEHARRPPADELTLGQDAVRLAAGVPDEQITGRLAAGSGRDPDGLALAVRAWTYGGTAALSVLEDEEAVDSESLARARAVLESAWEGGERPALHRSGNRWTTSGAPMQLRLGRDGRWWPYREERGRWVPAGTAATDPATALGSVLGDE